MKNPILNIQKLDFQWPALDPFLFCVHHYDQYPNSNGHFGPDADLSGRKIGQDFEIKDGYRMYHGTKVPGFPAHPHRGFETITVTTKGLIDHCDSMGAAGRYGKGDTQWMTAGKGVQHGEMFPLLNTEGKNELELFQIWINLPSDKKMCEPGFKMLWSEKTKIINEVDENQKSIQIKLINGEYKEEVSNSAPKDSWANKAQNQVALWLIEISQGATWQLPTSKATTNRMLYFYEGSDIEVADQKISVQHGLKMDSMQAVTIKNTGKTAKLLLLQGNPINEPIAQYGPFVMNTQQEIQEAFLDYRSTQFGGWPWESQEQIHGDQPRFAKYVNGEIETP